MMSSEFGAAPSDHDVARLVAAETGALLMALRQSMVGADPKRLRDEGDARAHALIMGRLAELRPQDAILSEEGKDDLRRLEHQRVWLVDPLDGTREFSEPPRDDWAVHVALCVDGIPVAGAVALPAQDIVFATGGALPEVRRSSRQLRIAASRTRAPAIVGELAAALGAEVLLMGSAGAKAMAVVKGDVDIYVHAGGQYEWDSAAPVAVALAAGLHASRIDGSALRYNRPDPYLPDLLICQSQLTDQVLAILRASLEAETNDARSDDEVSALGNRKLAL